MKFFNRMFTFDFLFSISLKPNQKNPPPLDRLCWKDENENEKFLEIFFEKGPRKGQCKGLRQIDIELGFDIDSIEKLNDLKALLVIHPAFSVSSKLEELGKKYGVKIIFLPKFHCELNPMEGVWCHNKQYVRRRTDQKFEKMKNLIKESREDFRNNVLNVNY